MIESTFGALCGRAIVDGQSGLASLIDIIEVLRVPTYAAQGVLPYIIPVTIVAVASWLDRDPDGGSRQLAIEIEDAMGGVVGRTNGAVPTWINGRARTISGFQGLLARVEGFYTVRLRMMDQHEAPSEPLVLRFWVSHLATPQPPA
jgi:hypothetical protein